MQRGLSARESSGNVVNHCPEPENRSGFATDRARVVRSSVYFWVGRRLIQPQTRAEFQLEICLAHLNGKVNATKLMTGRAVLLVVVRPAVERRRVR
jgi:hypothetical protein